jgi:hypothetical protein
VLALFRFMESRLPSEFYAHHMLRGPARAQRDSELKIEVQRVFAENFGVGLAAVAARAHGNIPAAEAEERYYAMLEQPAMAA